MAPDAYYRPSLKKLIASTRRLGGVSMKDHCPRCGSSRIVTGKGMHDSESDMSGFFVPSLPGWKLISTYAIPFESPLQACADCGLVWGEIDAESMTTLISKAGTKELKNQLGL